MRIQNNQIIASNGKTFKRKSDGLIFGKEVYLGYAYYLGGIKLDEPILEVPDDYEEIDIPNELLMIQE